jgi:hypothetical protein
MKSGAVLGGFDEFSVKSEKFRQKVNENIWLAQRRNGAKKNNRESRCTPGQVNANPDVYRDRWTRIF